MVNFSDFLLQSLEFEFIKEEVGYGTIDLLCDVGGTLSLLMGASLLTCCELFEVRRNCMPIKYPRAIIGKVSEIVLPFYYSKLLNNSMGAAKGRKE